MKNFLKPDEIARDWVSVNRKGLRYFRIADFFAANIALMPRPIDHRFGFAWLGFGLAVSIHVLDEATHDFLAFYNPNARAIRARFPFLPFPIFTLESFLASLAIAIAIFLCLSPFAFRGMRWARILAVPIALLAGVANAMGHTFSSIILSPLDARSLQFSPVNAGWIFLISTARSGHAEAANAAAAHCRRRFVTFLFRVIL